MFTWWGIISEVGFEFRLHEESYLLNLGSSATVPFMIRYYIVDDKSWMVTKYLYQDGKQK